MRFFLFRFDLGFLANRGLRPQSHGVDRALLGMSSPTLQEVPNAKIRLSTGLIQKKTDVAPNPPIGLLSNEGQQIILVGLCTVAKNSNYASRGAVLS